MSEEPQIKTITSQTGLAILAKQLQDLIEDREILIETKPSAIEDIQASYRIVEDSIKAIESEYPGFFPSYSVLQDRINNIDIFILRNCLSQTPISDHKSNKINFTSLGIVDSKEPSTDFLILIKESPTDNDDLIFTKKQEEKSIGLPGDHKSHPDKTGLLPPTDIAWRAINFSRSHCEKGTSDLENNKRSPEEFKRLRFNMKQVQNRVEKNMNASLDFMEASGITIEPELEGGAYLHHTIDGVKAAKLANCDEMIAMNLDWLENNDSNQVQAANVTGIKNITQKYSGHTFLAVKTKNGQQIWDSWLNVAYWDTEENRRKYLKCWEPGYTAQEAADHRLQDYNPNIHEESPDENFTLENLRLYRQTLANKLFESLTLRELDKKGKEALSTLIKADDIKPETHIAVKALTSKTSPGVFGPKQSPHSSPIAHIHTTQPSISTLV